MCSAGRLHQPQRENNSKHLRFLPEFMPHSPLRFRLQGWGLWPIVVAESSDFLKGDLKGKKGIMFQWSWANNGNLTFICLFMVPERRCTPPPC